MTFTNHIVFYVSPHTTTCLPLCPIATCLPLCPMAVNMLWCEGWHKNTDIIMVYDWQLNPLPRSRPCLWYTPTPTRMASCEPAWYITCNQGQADGCAETSSVRRPAELGWRIYKYVFPSFTLSPCAFSFGALNLFTLRRATLDVMALHLTSLGAASLKADLMLLGWLNFSFPSKLLCLNGSFIQTWSDVSACWRECNSSWPVIYRPKLNNCPCNRILMMLMIIIDWMPVVL